MNIMRKDQLRKLYDKYIDKGWLAITEIQDEFNLKREEVKPAIEKAIELYDKNKQKTA
ncbi:MAG: hypothetical protein KGD63_00650 [Candidatus Lokiarchaeota archaeon]|nr:hypothetical protein [Candidatus Lokiarchaeota archaeon]